MSDREQIHGIPLSSFSESIENALECYQVFSHNNVLFDGIDQAAELELTEDKSYSAESEVPVVHNQDGRTEIGKLVIIAFGPGDGTGNDDGYSLEDLDTGVFPRDPKVVPRDKSAVHSEVYLTVVTHQIGETFLRPMMYKGNLDVVGFRGSRQDRLVKISELGHRPKLFLDEWDCYPVTQLTVGHHNCLGNPALSGERLGDPHAIYNPWENHVQVAGFLALSPRVAADHLSIYDQLRIPGSSH